MSKRRFAAITIALFFLGTIICALPQQSIAQLDKGDQAPTFSPSEWINTTKQAQWSRKHLMELFASQYRNEIDHGKMPRTKVLSLLGEPQISYESPKTDNFADRATAKIQSEVSDYYRLSESSGNLEIDYNKDGMVKAYTDSDDPHTFVSAPASAQTQATVDNARQLARCHTMLEAEKLLGPPGTAQVNIPPDFATPFRVSSYVWKVPGQKRQFVWVTTSGMFNQDLNKRAIDGVYILTLSPDCPQLMQNSVKFK